MMFMAHDIFIENIKEKMAESGIKNSSQLANKSGLHRTSVGNLLKGSFSPSLETIEKIASALGCEAEDLVRKKDRVDNIDLDLLRKTLVQIENLMVKNSICIDSPEDKAKICSIWYNMRISTLEMDEATLNKQFKTIIDMLNINQDDSFID